MADPVPSRRDPGDEPTQDEITHRTDDPASPVEAERLSAADAVRYESLRPIGAGAMGEVSLCRDHRLGRDVAMKTIRRDQAADPAARRRFEREARVQGQLEHPAIVPVHDLGVTPDDGVFFTMKRVQGQSLRAILDGLRQGDPAFVERYGPHRLLSAFGTVCLAVALAHSRGIVHRDIKPANVMFGDFGEVYLLDWGIAKVRRRAGPADETRETAIELPPAIEPDSKVGDLVGTIGYMAPEQVRGEEVDERTDVYALGATLFEIVTGERLHPREHVAALQSTLHGVEARAHVRAPGRVVAPELEELCVRATSLEPRDRPASAREMSAIIERVLEGDRDVARRRQLSLDHTERAREEMRRALADRGDAREARERAIQEVHRAIVLDGANHEAIDILTRLAREPAGDVTHAADEALQAATRRMRRSVARAGVLLFVVWIVGITCGALLGLRSPWVLLIGAPVLAAGGLVAWFRARIDNGWVTLTALVLADLAAALTGAAFGPFVLVPGILACIAVAFTVASSPIHGVPEREAGSRVIRYTAMALGVLAFLAPIALEHLGVVPPSVVIRDGALVILPRAIDFPARWTLAFLVVVNTGIILIPSFIAARVRDLTIRAERRAFGSLARMRHLLPDVAKVAIERKPEGDDV